MDSKILLENGTNELEILEFMIGDSHYGINVAKIKEIVQYQNVTLVPNAHPFVEGIFMPRDVMITVIDLAKATGAAPSGNKATDMLIITNFNMLNIAFHVHRVCGIHRVSWTEIITPDSTINDKDKGITTGVVKIDGKLIVILDFEHIVNDISPETGLKISEVEKYATRERNQIPVYIAEDSGLLMKLISDSLKKAGYENLNLSVNGQECWDKVSKLGAKYTDKVTDYVGLIITDIEMPLMDGHRLTKLVKSDNYLKNVPVVIFSSLINDEMKIKGKALGADAQLSKPEIGLLVEEIDKLLLI
ncbi:MAG: chemotaxis protein [Butyrivibrio sp.]|nr:chemotaxis protein [Butyrivibrio sp.]